MKTGRAFTARSCSAPANQKKSAREALELRPVFNKRVVDTTGCPTSSYQISMLAQSLYFWRRVLFFILSHVFCPFKREYGHSIIGVDNGSQGKLVSAFPSTKDKPIQKKCFLNMKLNIPPREVRQVFRKKIKPFLEKQGVKIRGFDLVGRQIRKAVYINNVGNHRPSLPGEIGIPVGRQRHPFPRCRLWALENRSRQPALHGGANYMLFEEPGHGRQRPEKADHTMIKERIHRNGRRIIYRPPIGAHR